MSLTTQITSSIKTRKMNLEDKIVFLENLHKIGINLSNLPINYVSKEGIIVNNVIINIKKYYTKNLMTTEQTIKCENLGIDFQDKATTTDFKINFLKKATEEGYNLVYIIKNNEKYKNNSIYRFIEDLRNSYEEDALDDFQIDECINKLKIIIPKNQRTEIALNIIRDCTLKNIISYSEKSTNVM